MARRALPKGDGGRTWAQTAYTGSAFGVATSPDGNTVAVVTMETAFSGHRTATWPGP